MRRAGGWCKLCGLMPVRSARGGCGFASTIWRSMGGRGGSWWRTCVRRCGGVRAGRGWLSLVAAWQAVAAEQAVALPPRGTPFRLWAQRLAEHARDERVAAELSYWSGAMGQPSLLLVQERLEPGADTDGIGGEPLVLSAPA